MRRIACSVCNCKNSFTPACVVVFESMPICERCRYTVVSWFLGQFSPHDPNHVFLGEFMCMSPEPIVVEVVRNQLPDSETSG